MHDADASKEMGRMAERKYTMIKHTLNLMNSVFTFPRAFDPNKAGWKLDDKGLPVMKDGNPVYIDSNGQESTVDGGTIARLNAESRGHRIAKEAAETKLAEFKDIDPATAKKAIETVGKLDAKKLIEAGEVDKVRAEISGQFTTQLSEKDKAISDLTSKLDNMNIDGVFAQSSFVRERIAVPPDMFQASFRNNFKMKDGKLEAYDKSGNRIMSKKNIGDYADPEEALQILVEQHPQKDTILRASGNSGSNNGGNGGGRGGERIVKRAEFDKLSPMEQQQTALKASKGELSIVD